MADGKPRSHPQLAVLAVCVLLVLAQDETTPLTFDLTGPALIPATLIGLSTIRHSDPGRSRSLSARLEVMAAAGLFFLPGASARRRTSPISLDADGVVGLAPDPDALIDTTAHPGKCAWQCSNGSNQCNVPVPYIPHVSLSHKDPSLPSNPTRYKPATRSDLLCGGHGAAAFPASTWMSRAAHRARTAACANASSTALEFELQRALLRHLPEIPKVLTEEHSGLLECLGSRVKYVVEPSVENVPYVLTRSEQMHTVFFNLGRLGFNLFFSTQTAQVAASKCLAMCPGCHVPGTVGFETKESLDVFTRGDLISFPAGTTMLFFEQTKPNMLISGDLDFQHPKLRHEHDIRTALLEGLKRSAKVVEGTPMRVRPSMWPQGSLDDNSVHAVHVTHLWGQIACMRHEWATCERYLDEACALLWRLEHISTPDPSFSRWLPEQALTRCYSSLHNALSKQRKVHTASQFGRFTAGTRRVPPPSLRVLSSMVRSLVQPSPAPTPVTDESGGWHLVAVLGLLAGVCLLMLLDSAWVRGFVTTRYLSTKRHVRPRKRRKPVEEGLAWIPKTLSVFAHRASRAKLGLAEPLLQWWYGRRDCDLTQRAVAWRTRRQLCTGMDLLQAKSKTDVRLRWATLAAHGVRKRIQATNVKRMLRWAYRLLKHNRNQHARRALRFRQAQHLGNQRVLLSTLGELRRHLHRSRAEVAAGELAQRGETRLLSASFQHMRRGGRILALQHTQSLRAQASYVRHNMTVSSERLRCHAAVNRQQEACSKVADSHVSRSGLSAACKQLRSWASDQRQEVTAMHLAYDAAPELAHRQLLRVQRRGLASGLQQLKIFAGCQKNPPRQVKTPSVAPLPEVVPPVPQLPFERIFDCVWNRGGFEPLLEHVVMAQPHPSILATVDARPTCYISFRDPRFQDQQCGVLCNTADVSSTVASLEGWSYVSLAVATIELGDVIFIPPNTAIVVASGADVDKTFLAAASALQNSGGLVDNMRPLRLHCVGEHICCPSHVSDEKQLQKQPLDLPTPNPLERQEALLAELDEEAAARALEQELKRAKRSQKRTARRERHRQRLSEAIAQKRRCVEIWKQRASQAKAVGEFVSRRDKNSFQGGLRHWRYNLGIDRAPGRWEGVRFKLSINLAFAALVKMSQPRRILVCGDAVSALPTDDATPLHLTMPSGSVLPALLQLSREVAQPTVLCEQPPVECTHVTPAHIQEIPPHQCELSNSNSLLGDPHCDPGLQSASVLERWIPSAQSDRHSFDAVHRLQALLNVPELVLVGSLAHGTHLNYHDIDVCLPSPPGEPAAQLMLQINSQLCAEALKTGSSVSFIGARVPNILFHHFGCCFNISAGQAHSVAMAILMKSVDRAVPGGLFASSLRLIKAWIRMHEAGWSGATRISSHCIHVLVMTLFNCSGERIRSPLDAILMFIHAQATFDYENFVITMYGPRSRTEHVLQCEQTAGVCPIAPITNGWVCKAAHTAGTELPVFDDTVAHGARPHFKFGALNVADPILVTENCGVRVGSSTLQRLQHALERAQQIVQTTDARVVLCALFSMHPHDQVV